MTREEAIFILERDNPNNIAIRSGFESLYDERKEAFSMAIKALEQETVSKEVYDHEYFLRKEFELKIDKLQRQLEALEQEPRWIPTSDRLPEEDGEYYATIYDTDENYQYMDIAELENGIWQYKDYIKVLAWMPLPEPYKAESEPQESENKDE